MRIMIAEDSGLFRQVLSELLSENGLTVTGQAATVEELMRLVDNAPPDLVILDIRLPPGQRDEGLRVAEILRARYPRIGLLILSHYAETAYAMRLLSTAHRAVGYLIKDRVPDARALLEAIDRIAHGHVVIDPEVVGRLVERRRTVDLLHRLTPGERQVLSLVAEGYSNVAIAGRLAYSVKTVEKRITAISQKLGLADAEGRADVNVRVLAVLAYLRSGLGHESGVDLAS
ncbi:response regulator transcription factor [Sphaerisporangium sp. NPDC049002]|uniref:response regulator transcription factor n=1 Tax=unclassified Sphaerisporangium TaxID=2630420 RepID=UPI0033E725D1